MSVSRLSMRTTSLSPRESAAVEPLGEKDGANLAACDPAYRSAHAGFCNGP